MKITHQLPTDSNKVSLADMKPGDVARGDDDRYWFVVGGSVVCFGINGVPYVFSHQLADTEKNVTLLPPGTVITIEV